MADLRNSDQIRWYWLEENVDYLQNKQPQAAEQKFEHFRSHAQASLEILKETIDVKRSPCEGRNHFFGFTDLNAQEKSNAQLGCPRGKSMPKLAK